MTLESLSASIARRKSRPFAKMCACPQNSSNVRGRIRAASGSRCGDSRLGACVGRSKSDAIKPSSGDCAPPMRFEKKCVVSTVSDDLALGYSFAIRRAAAVYGLRPYAGFGAAISSPAPSASRFLAQKTPAVIGYCVRDIASMRYRFMMT